MALTTITGNMVSINAIQGTLIADNAITAVHIATNAVSGTLIADNAVTAVHIAQNTITVTQLADDCVESDKIADGIITTNHLNKAMISSQTEVTAATGDFVLLGDTSDSNNLKKVPVSSIVALASGGVDGISSSADATAITIDSSERVGIGIASPTTELHIFSADQNALTVETDTAVNQIHLSNSTNSPTYITQDSYGLTFKADDNGWGGTASNITFKVKGSEKARILSSGGITFNGDTAAANALDDYEEGTWTPAFYTYSGVTTSSITINLATYTKIGNICHIHANIDVTLSSLPGQTVTITGLPFAASNAGATGQRGIIAVGGDTANTGGNTPKAHFRTNGSQLDGVYYNASNNTAYWAYAHMDSPTFALHIHGFYTV